MTWAGRNERRNSILMTCHYPDLGSVADRSWRVGNLLQPIISTSQIRVVTHLFISMKFLYSFPRRHFARKPVVLGLRNAGCFLKRDLMLFKCNKRQNSIIFFFQGQQNKPKTVSEYVDFDIRKNNQSANLTTVNATWSNDAWSKKRPAFFK